MTSLEETFGEDFAEQYQQQIAEKREERNSITEEQLGKMCALAIVEDKFHDGEPTFQYNTENGVTHDVILVEAPEPRGDKTLWDYLEEPWDGAARLPMSYLGDWHNCTFPDAEDVKKIEQGEHYIIVGSWDEWENDDGDVYTNISPVRGIASLEEANEWAKKYLGDEGFDVSEESEDEETEESDDGGFEGFGSSDDDEEEEEEEEEEESSDPFGDVGGSDDEDEEESDDDSDSSGGSIGGGLTDLAGDTEEDEEEEEEEEDDSVTYGEVSNFVEKLAEDQDEDEEPQIFEIEEGDDELDRLVEIVAGNFEGLEKESVREITIETIEHHREDDDDDDGDELSDQLF